ncbi:uncharacterized protein LOC6582931 [Drosophila mojavensis]|uniref:Uncharacterized protein n=2 Tax=mojavensis species complex TaxID=198037 RepID=B4L054_DROMO|nr:uncharacterized protein LOC6582931 [Drosophila mojavensis]XP_017864512.1 PREDICTED: uncharacterized protein LOC108614776 [Drosophila arizonae]EDW19089.1 uncharacterized protein Dmoj_GI11718 [Drosophila mojavensis]
MAIPFYEDEPETATAANLDASQITDADQVDGPPLSYSSNDANGYDQVDYEAPSASASASASAATSNTQATSTDNNEMPPSTEEQLLVWKMLALAMCKVLKQFYLQQKKQQQPGKTTKLTATVQIQPQAQ